MRGAILILIPVLFFGLLGLYFFATSTDERASTESSAAPEELAKSDTQNPFRTERDRYLSIAKEKGMAQALVTLRGEMGTNPVVSTYCHEIAHELGRAVYEAGVDLPTALKDQDDVCSYGYLHGLMQGKFRAEGDLETTLASLSGECGTLPAKGAERGECFHGIGHGLMFYLSNELPDAVDHCRKFEGQDKTDCASGAYMENFTSDPLHPSAYASSADHFYPCAEQPEDVRASCYLYAPYQFLGSGTYTVPEAARICENAESAYRRDCYYGIGYYIAQHNSHDPVYSELACKQIQGDMEAVCLEGFFWMQFGIDNLTTVEEATGFCSTLSRASRVECKDFIDRLSKSGAF